MKEFFKRDSWLLGIGMAIVIPVITYFIIQGITLIVVGKDVVLFQKGTNYLLAVFANLIPFRYYTVRLKADKTSKGILLLTFAYAMVYFYMFWSE